MTIHNGEMARTPKTEQLVQPRFKLRKRPLFLKEWRKYRDDMTQERLAERAGVSQGMISQLENNRSDYTGEMLEALADALSCQPADLIMRNPLDPEAPWSIWETLKPEHRKQTIRFMRMLKEDEEEAA